MIDWSASDRPSAVCTVLCILHLRRRHSLAGDKSECQTYRSHPESINKKHKIKDLLLSLSSLLQILYEDLRRAN